jgi:hypothetical protein
MSSRIKNIALLTALFSLQALGAYEPPAAPAARPFNYDTDTFAFANETVWNYVNGAVRDEPSQANKHQREYTRRCFVVTRSAVQFWKFARFDPHAPALSSNQLAERIRQVTERSVWLPSLSKDKRIVFPGYHHLREASAANKGLFEANIGLGWPVYFRTGNMPIVVPVASSIEADLNGEIFHDLHENDPTIVWLYNFPSLNINHVVVIFAGSRSHDHFHYLVYDPNYITGPKKLDYDAKTKTFSYQPTFYFKGGRVTARAIYRGIFQ